MYIRELTGYKTNQHYQQAQDTFKGDLNNTDKRIGSLVNFQKYLMKNGFTPEGSGQGGAAFTHPTYPWVFKIFTHDPAYLDFFKYAKQHQNNPAIPKLKGNIIKINDNTFVVRMEKLEKIYDKQNLKVIKFFRNISDLEEWTQAEKLYPTMFDEIKQNYPNFYQVIYDMIHNYPHYVLDMHTGNAMTRVSDGTLVVTDPIV